MMSGIEFKDATGKLVYFVAIDDKNNKSKTFRIALQLDKDEVPILPPKKTFEQLIQEKRRQQQAPPKVYHGSSLHVAEPEVEEVEPEDIHHEPPPPPSPVLNQPPPSPPASNPPSPTSMSRAETISLKAITSKSKYTHGCDPAVVQRLLKSAPAGSVVILPNGQLVRKSRRGGARAGAGRKRSRPDHNQ